MGNMGTNKSPLAHAARGGAAKPQGEKISLPNIFTLETPAASGGVTSRELQLICGNHFDSKEYIAELRKLDKLRDGSPVDIKKARATLVRVHCLRTRRVASA